MKLPLHIARNLLALCEPACKIPASAMKHAIVTKMIEDGVVEKMQISKSKSYLYLKNISLLAAYLQNNFGIYALTEYIAGLENPLLSRSDAVAIAGNSKLKSVRTFKGFLINSYEPIAARLNNTDIVVHPPTGSFVFIHDYENFEIESDVCVVGIENAENFMKIGQQKYLFDGKKMLFVSRYPQSSDLVKWLQTIPNQYLHFGDLDFAGISIYLSEFKIHLGNRSGFFVPALTEKYLTEYGNRSLFNMQFNAMKAYISAEHETAVQKLYELILRHKKVLEQEIFIRSIPNKTISNDTH
jgi:hypothetical protein